MTASRFARVALPSLALSIASFALPAGAAAAAGLEDDVAFPADDAGPATRRVDERRRANDNDWFRAPAAAGPVDFPSAEIHDAVIANTRAATARAMYRRAESAMHAAARAAIRDFEESKELKDALAEEQRAFERLQDARRGALKEVLDDPQYQARQDLREELSEQIASRREGVPVRPDDPARLMRVGGRPRLVSTEFPAERPLPGEDGIVSIAVVKLRIGSEVSKMERDALADNEDVRRAREELVAASGKVGALRDDFDRRLRENDAFRAAREELEDARIARVTAETYNLGASIAAEEALDFAYYLHRYDYYRYNQRDYGYGYHSYRFGYPYYGASFYRR
jgi:hypothetical protein